MAILCYGSSPTVVYTMWQTSESGQINGINGYVDTDQCYVAYPSIIKGLHKNGY